MRALVLLVAAIATATLGAVDPAAAGATDPTTTRFKILTHNIAGGAMNNGGPGALALMESRIEAFNPSMVVLNEACGTQVATFRASHPTWTVEETVFKTEYGLCPDGTLYDVLASPHPITGVTRTDLGHNHYAHGGNKVYHLTCGDLTLPEETIRACATHLRSGQDGETRTESAAIRAEQVEVIHQTLLPLFQADRHLALAGDLNFRPQAAGMDPLYRIDRADGTKSGPGFFYEGDQSDPDLCGTDPFPYDWCRLKHPTNHNGAGIDHAMVSRNWQRGGVDLGERQYETATSGHMLVQAWFDVTPSGARKRR